MATVPSEITWVTGQVVTAAQLNSNLRDAVNFLINRPLCELRQTIAQTFTSGVSAATTFDTDDVNNDGMHSTVTNPTRATAQTAGRYVVSGGIGFASNATGARVAFLAINGSTNNGSGIESTPVAGGGVTLIPVRTKTIFLSVGNYVEMLGLQSSGGNLNTDVTTLDQSNFTVRWVGTT